MEDNPKVKKAPMSKIHPIIKIVTVISVPKLMYIFLFIKSGNKNTFKHDKSGKKNYKYPP